MGVSPSLCSAEEHFLKSRNTLLAKNGKCFELSRRPRTSMILKNSGNYPNRLKRWNQNLNSTYWSRCTIRNGIYLSLHKQANMQVTLTTQSLKLMSRPHCSPHQGHESAHKCSILLEQKPLIRCKQLWPKLIFFWCLSEDLDTKVSAHEWKHRFPDFRALMTKDQEMEVCFVF